jgi:hypothetical protein
MPATITGYRVHCKPCGLYTYASRDDVHALWDALATPDRYYSALPCRSCGAWHFAQSVTGKPGRRPCGPWCTEGYGLACTCECAGANHGADLAFAPGELWCLR